MAQIIDMVSRPAAALLLLTLFAGPAVAQERVVLDGFPDSFVYADADTTGRDLIAPEAREKNRVAIVERDGEYFWITRENRRLIHALSGLYHYFIDPRGGGYVKVLDQTDEPPESLLRQEGPDVQFIEHISLQLGSLTYFGHVSRWDPPKSEAPQEEELAEVALRCVDAGTPSIWFILRLSLESNTARLEAFAGGLYGDSGSVSVSRGLYRVAVPLPSDSSISNVLEVNRITGEGHLITVDSEGAPVPNTFELTLGCEEIGPANRL